MTDNERIETKVLRIMAYGNRILRRPCLNVCEENDELNAMVVKLWNTMEASGGIGLAAPQVNNNSKVFIVNSKLMYNDMSDSQREAVFKEDKGIKETFITC